MRRWCLWVLALSGLLAAKASAQRVELGASLGYMVPVRSQFDRAVEEMYRGVPMWFDYTGRQQASLVVSARAAVWPRPRVGFELIGSAYGTVRTVEMSPPFWPGPARGNATVTSVAARLAVVVERSAHREIQLALGPQVTFLSGAAYDDPPATVVGLGRRTAWGASAAATMQYPLSRRVSIRAAFDAAVYKVRLVPPGGADTTRTPFQVDLAPSFGLVVHVP